DSAEFGGWHEFDGRSTYGLGSDPALGPDESGEVFVEPVSPTGGPASAWGAASMPVPVSGATIAAVSAPSRAGGPGGAAALGRFRILGVLGQGRHATVYRAHDAVLDRDVALKVPRPGVLRTEKSLERFLGEARAQARLRHPRIVPVFEAGRAGHRHYIA